MFFSHPTNLSSLNGAIGTKGFVVNGVSAYDQTGKSVSSAGDVNGDNIEDIIIGAYRASPNSNSYAGSSYVLFGSTNIGNTGTINLSTALDGSNGFVINGAYAYDDS